MDERLRPSAYLLNELRAARVGAGVSQRDMAKKAGYSSIDISRWELGMRDPRSSTLVTLAETLGKRVVLVDK
jgi:transcriptional regulator with XRE-family HTH domain